MQFLVSKLSHVLSPCLGIFIFGCGGNPSIPDAPPPYPTYSTPSYTPPGDSNGYPSPSSYPPITPSLGSQYSNQTDLSPSYKQDYFAPPPNPNQSSLNPRYTVTAEANIWVLVQDEFGTEIDWKKLSKGESMSITHPRPITVTCSSGSKVKIYDEKGKAVKQLINSSGIAIVRLP